MGPFAIRNVTIDGGDRLKNRLIFSDDFQDIFRKIPSLAEIRSKFRIEDNKTKLGGQFVAQGYISTNYDKKNPSKIGRTSKAEPTPRFGYTPIGNAIDNRGKRFTPKGDRQ